MMNDMKDWSGGARPEAVGKPCREGPSQLYLTMEWHQDMLHSSKVRGIHINQGKDSW